MPDIYYIIPYYLAKVFQSSNSVRMMYNQADESNYEIRIPLELKENMATIWLRNACKLMGIKEYGINIVMGQIKEPYAFFLSQALRFHLSNLDEDPPFIYLFLFTKTTGNP